MEAETTPISLSPAPHADAVEDVLQSHQVSLDTGLSEAEIIIRRRSFGPNRIEPPQLRPAWQRFLDQFNNILLYVLLASAVTTALLAHWIDTGVILGVVLINALIGFIQEGRAEDALRSVRATLSIDAHVVRNGSRATVDAEKLVPGDIVILGAGDRVPADLRIVRAHGLQLQEAILTGESDQVEKTPEPVNLNAALGDRSSMAHAGTLVTYGSGKGVVTATGDRSEIGQIGSLLLHVESVDTPLLRQMSFFGRWLTAAILLLSVLTFALGTLVQGFAFDEMFLAAVGLAVAAIPEGLPAVMSITLALGVTRMARRKAIVRRLPAVETLGSVTVICSDKTGTLTRNELMIQSVVTGTHGFNVTGHGYEPRGKFITGDDTITPADHADLMLAARAAVLCNDAELTKIEGEWKLEGSPTDGALLALAIKAGVDVADERRAWQRIDLIPFDSSHKFMATMNRTPDEKKYVFVKGAPERIFDMCDAQQHGTETMPLDKPFWHARIEELTSEAQRVLAIAHREVPKDRAELDIDKMDGGFTLLALFGLIDPPRPEAIDAIATCRSAGIDVNMITGDHVATAKAIGKHFNLGHEEKAVTGAELDAVGPRDETPFNALVRGTDIFARTTPKHKLRIVETLQASGEVVAVTGDGVNDAPALKRADIGIAMGRKGTDAAREASEMVLIDDNFASIVEAIRVGRGIYDNLVKTILFVLPTSVGEAATVIVAVLLGLPLPVAPVQILWINMVTATTLGLALAFEPEEGSVMDRPPRDPKAPILSRYLIWRVVFMSVLLLFCAFGLFNWVQSTGAGIDAARTAAVNALVAGEIGNLFNCRRLRETCMNWSGLTGNQFVLGAIAIVVILQFLFTSLPIMNALFHTTPISLEAWGLIGLCTLGVFLLVEAEKLIVRRLKL